MKASRASNNAACVDCWWQENGRCYEGKYRKVPHPDAPIVHVSSKIARGRACSKFKAKRVAGDKE
ncbi:hypothetical protein KAR91_19525 [Candidatus Pacearchaeota archaeon]|nr:hypothetical protein [Candidatus Pacearchaeota archaeon]